MKFINDLFDINHFYGLIYGIIGALFIWGCGRIYDYFQHKSKYTGAWEIKTFYNNGRQRAKHIIKIKRHNLKTGIIEGVTEQVFPVDDTKKQKSLVS
jgi:hypothetical protein